MKSQDQEERVSTDSIPNPSSEKVEPQGFSEAMPLFDHCIDLQCEEQTRLPVSFQRLNRFLVCAFLILLLALLFLPWQQFVRGQGKVTAFDPMERSVLVEAPLPGRVEKVSIAEGQRIKKGDPLVQLVDNDPNLLANLKLQQTDLKTQREATQAKYERLLNRITQFESSLPEALRVAKQQIEAARFAEEAAELQFERIKALYEDPRGLASERDWELARLQRNSKRAETLQKESSLVKTKLDLEASLESARASSDTARSDLAKVDKELRATEIKISQTGRQSVHAPRDGIVYRLRATEGTFLKAGSPLCSIVPEVNQYVAELWIDGNDMPLLIERKTDSDGTIVQKGSPVRLQFEGWPAIQFVGWPSVAVGTFGGEVIFVDAIDNGQGQFRVLIAPDPDQISRSDGEEQIIPWPASPIMRQGIQTQGWILLERVPLWFEVWRQLNGFPPTLNRESPVGKQGAKS